MYIMQTTYFRQLCICTEFTLKWQASETEVKVAGTYASLLVIPQCTSSLDCLFRENSVLQLQSEKQLNQAKLLPLAECRKLFFHWHIPTLSNSGLTTLIFYLLWSTSSKCRSHHTVLISDSLYFFVHFWTHFQICTLLFWSMFLMWRSITMDRFVLLPLEALLTE